MLFRSSFRVPHPRPQPQLHAWLRSSRSPRNRLGRLDLQRDGLDPFPGRPSFRSDVFLIGGRNDQAPSIPGPIQRGQNFAFCPECTSKTLSRAPDDGNAGWEACATFTGRRQEVRLSVTRPVVGRRCIAAAALPVCSGMMNIHHLEAVLHPWRATEDQSGRAAHSLWHSAARVSKPDLYCSRLTSEGNPLTETPFRVDRRRANNCLATSGPPLRT